MSQIYAGKVKKEDFITKMVVVQKKYKKLVNMKDEIIF